MFSFLPTIILRHRKENLKKCSLRGLESRSDCSFYTYPNDLHLFSSPQKKIHFLENYILLDVDAPPLCKEDSHLGLFLIDATWNLALTIKNSLPPFTIKRSLPGDAITAYPRRQTGCSDPTRGLASIEALYLAHKTLGRDTSGLLDNYHWKDRFLEINHLTQNS